MEIDWESLESEILFNPALSSSDIARLDSLKKQIGSFDGHLWLATSGSRAPKWVGLSKSSILISAAAVNKHIDGHHKDRWIQALPDYHVGGLGVRARAYLSGAEVFDFRQENKAKWNPQAFYSYVKEKNGTLLSLVPAQLYDLLKMNAPPPASVRLVIIGGGVLMQEELELAVRLGWPVLPSYGLSECASQVATAKNMGEGSLYLLSHVEAQIKAGIIWLKSQSLLTCYARLIDDQWTFHDPKINGWFATEDKGELVGTILKLSGRADQHIKIGGESVDLQQLENRLQSLCRKWNAQTRMALLDQMDLRLGKVIHLVTEPVDQSLLNNLLNEFHHEVLPFERIRKVHFVDSIPISDLYKVQRESLRAKIDQSLRE